MLSTAPRLQTCSWSSLRRTVEIATTRCCSSGRNEEPVSSSARGEHLLGHRVVVALEAEPAPELRVGDRLDVEHEAVGAAAHAPFFIRTAKATTRPASSVRLT